MPSSSFYTCIDTSVVSIFSSSFLQESGKHFPKCWTTTLKCGCTKTSFSLVLITDYYCWSSFHQMWDKCTSVFEYFYTWCAAQISSLFSTDRHQIDVMWISKWFLIFFFFVAHECIVTATNPTVEVRGQLLFSHLLQQRSKCPDLPPPHGCSLRLEVAAI